MPTPLGAQETLDPLELWPSWVAQEPCRAWKSSGILKPGRSEQAWGDNVNSHSLEKRPSRKAAERRCRDQAWFWPGPAGPGCAWSGQERPRERPSGGWGAPGPGPRGPRSSGARSSKAQVLGGPGPAGGKSVPAGRGFPSPTPPPSGPNLPEGGGGRPGGKAPRWRARPVRPGSRGRTTRKGMSGGPNAAERVGPGQLTSERRRLPVGTELPARLPGRPGRPGRAAPEPEVLPAGGAGRPG